MTQKTSSASTTQQDDGYADFERLIAARVHAATGPLFTTNVDSDVLWLAYLSGFPDDKRQHYNCHACRRFVQRYGGLVTVAGDGTTRSPLWVVGELGREPSMFRRPCDNLWKVVHGERITGVFLSSDETWGTPLTGDWSHLSGRNPNVFRDPLKTAGQAMAEKREEYAILCHGLADYPRDLVKEAVRVLKADALYRSEKAVAVADWFLGVHNSVDGVKDRRRRDARLWYAVATAPPGFCHVRSTMISTLLDDLKAGLPFAEVSRRWAAKTHPLQYQRPQAAPSLGQVENAEKLVEKLGIAASLKRRYATLDDVLSFVWREPVAAELADEKAGGVFDHLKLGRKATTHIELPPKDVTWEKFHREVFGHDGYFAPYPTSLEVLVPYHGGFYGLVTAADPDAPPILQWDGLESVSAPTVTLPRNPVSWYFYQNGSDAPRWNLSSGWRTVTAVFLAPHRWQEPTKFSHHGDFAFFALKDCWDSNADNCGLGLFPENLKTELRGVRSVIEAYSKKGRILDPEKGTANGLAFQGGSSPFGRPEPVTVRVTTRDGSAVYRIDRWE